MSKRFSTIGFGVFRGVETGRRDAGGPRVRSRLWLKSFERMPIKREPHCVFGEFFMANISVPVAPGKLDLKKVEAQLALCPSLPSLGSINKALQGLLHAEQRFSAQISEIIRRDPSLTSRLLRLVNSVYYGLSTPVNSIEEAVFYLGVRQIRQLTTVTPIIEDFQRLSGKCAFPWREFWQHCIGSAILTREVISTVQTPNDEADYVAGLVHDVGKIVMAWSFPDHFAEIHRQAVQG